MATEQLTYAQIAERLGASVEAARAIVTRHHLPRSRSNNGKTLVSIDVEAIQYRRVPARSPGNHRADRLAAAKDRPVAELQPVCALQEAAQVNERLSTLEAELAAEQQRSARHLADYKQERDRADRLAGTKDQAELQAVCALQEAAQVNERISTLEAELAAEQQRSASHLADYQRERDRADRLAATTDQLVAELQAECALHEAVQVNKRISTLEPELAAEQQRSASHLADYEQECDRASYAVLRARAGELLSECISNGPYLLNRALRRVMMSAAPVIYHFGYATRITVTAGNRALQDVTLVVRRPWEVLRARCTNMDGFPNKSIASTRLFFTLVGADAFYLLGRLPQIGRVAWFRFIFVITAPIRLVARMLLSIFTHADPPTTVGKLYERESNRHAHPLSAPLPHFRNRQRVPLDDAKNGAGARVCFRDDDNVARQAGLPPIRSNPSPIRVAR
jgi:hypothetical protein